MWERGFGDRIFWIYKGYKDCIFVEVEILEEISWKDKRWLLESIMFEINIYSGELVFGLSSLGF